MMGTGNNNCHHFCGDQQHIAFFGLMDDEPRLCDHNNELINGLFLKMTMMNDDHGDTTITVPANDNNKTEDREAVMQLACMDPTRECHKLVGGSVHIVTNRFMTIEEEGSTFHGSQTFGDESKCRSAFFVTASLSWETRVEDGKSWEWRPVCLGLTHSLMSNHRNTKPHVGSSLTMPCSLMHPTTMSCSVIS